jgi:hypothetical protein
MGVGKIVAALALALAVGVVAESRAANWLEMNFGLSGPRYEAKVPLCEDWWVTNKIQWRFAEKEGRFWNSDLRIAAIEDIRERAFRPWHYDSIPRRFCSGSAIISDGSRRPIFYGIGEDTGILGITWGVEWCVVGLDRNMAYNPACKMAKP